MEKSLFYNKLDIDFICESGCSLMLGILVFSIFEAVSSFDFITLDDYTYIVNNELIQKGLSIEGIKWAFSGSISMYVPLTFVSYMLDWQIYSGYPGGFHFSNLILHVLNSILVFIVLKRYTKKALPSMFVGLLFAFHPIHVESIAWVSERKDVLSTFFFLTSLYCYWRQVKKTHTLNSAMLNVSYLLCLLSKPMLVTFPFVLLLLDYWPLNRFGLDGADKKRGGDSMRYYMPRVITLIREKTLLLLLAAVFSIFALMATKSHGGLVSFQVIPLNIRIENGVLSYATYLKNLIWPMDLAVFYPHPKNTISTSALGVSALLILIITVWVIRAGKNHPYFPMGWFWYLGTMVPVTGISQSGMQAMADRFAYVPFIGLYIMFSWGTCSLISKIKLKFHDGIYVAMILTVIPMLMVLTHNQLSLWRNSESLYTHTLQVTQNNYIIHYAMGDLMVQKGRLSEAKDHFVKAMQMEPGFTNAIFNVGKIHQMQGRKKDALLMYHKVLDLRPDHYPVHKQLGYLWLELEHFDNAVFYLKKAIHLKPDSAQLHNDLAYALLRGNKMNEAVIHFKKAVQLEPKNSEYQENYQKALELASSFK